MTSVDEPDAPARPGRRRSRGRDRMRRRAVVVISIVVIVPLLMIAAGALWFAWQLNPPGEPGDELELRIEEGWSISRIGDELADRDVIGSTVVFNVYARLSGKTDFQAGVYDFRRDMGVRGAVSTLEGGPRIDYVELAVPPGLWAVEVADRVGQVPGRDREEFLNATFAGVARSKYQPATPPVADRSPLEGLLWPDTYRVAESEDEIAILVQMVEQFDAHADAVGLETATTEGRTPYEIIVVASLIEAEARVDDDRALIASVIYNRLRQDMPLQIDATLLYASGDPEKRSITEADQQAPSPYNTYLNQGLPPTPIANVSEASLRAAISPAATDFLYYVIADADGRHAFSATYEQHLANIEAARAAGLL